MVREFKPLEETSSVTHNTVNLSVHSSGTVCPLVDKLNTTAASLDIMAKK